MRQKNRLEQALSQISADLSRLGKRWALVGGLAVSARCEPRTTRDVDLAVHVEDDAEVEQLLFSLRELGYELLTVVEQRGTGRLATARLSRRDPSPRAPVVDLLFASCGIEPEIVDAASALHVLPDITVPVAAVRHLIAMKVLARDDRKRPQDWDDLRALFALATPDDLLGAREALQLITTRGAARGRDLNSALDQALTDTQDT